MWIVYLVMFLVVTVISLLWVSGIDYMQKNHPDYKGEELSGFDFDDDISDWDVTLMDGLEDEEFSKDYDKE